jgi:hypothetical protein
MNKFISHTHKYAFSGAISKNNQRRLTDVSRNAKYPETRIGLKHANNRTMNIA